MRIPNAPSRVFIEHPVVTLSVIIPVYNEVGSIGPLGSFSRLNQQVAIPAL